MVRHFIERSTMQTPQCRLHSLDATVQTLQCKPPHTKLVKERGIFKFSKSISCELKPPVYSQGTASEIGLDLRNTQERRTSYSRQRFFDRFLKLKRRCNNANRSTESDNNAGSNQASNAESFQKSTCQALFLWLKDFKSILLLWNLEWREAALSFMNENPHVSFNRFL